MTDERQRGGHEIVQSREKVLKQTAPFTQIPMSSLQRIKTLRLSNQICSVYPEIRLLSNLTHLDLTSTDLWEVPNLRQNSALKILFMDDNALCSIPNWLQELKQLKELYVSQNVLFDLPSTFSHLRQLEILDLSYNQFKEPPRCLSQLTIHTLDFSNNPLTQSSLNFIFPYSLRSLFLSNCMLKRFPRIRNLNQLEVLDVSDNTIPFLPKWINEYQNLLDLNLSRNPITLRKELGELRQLKKLDMSFTPLLEIPSWLATLKNLKLIVYISAINRVVQYTNPQFE